MKTRLFSLVMVFFAFFQSYNANAHDDCEMFVDEDIIIGIVILHRTMEGGIADWHIVVERYNSDPDTFYKLGLYIDKIGGLESLNPNPYFKCGHAERLGAKILKIAYPIAGAYDYHRR